MSAASAARGAWLALAGANAITMQAASNSVAWMRWRMSVVLAGVAGGRRRRVVVDRQAHRLDLVLLGDDDFLRKPAHRFVAARPQHRPRHVDRALVVRDHHCHEIAVDIAG